MQINSKKLNQDLLKQREIHEQPRKYLKEFKIDNSNFTQPIIYRWKCTQSSRLLSLLYFKLQNQCEIFLRISQRGDWQGILDVDVSDEMCNQI
jgi:hypothetical protein